MRTLQLQVVHTRTFSVYENFVYETAGNTVKNL